MLKCERLKKKKNPQSTWSGSQNNLLQHIWNTLRSAAASSKGQAMLDKKYISYSVTNRLLNAHDTLKVY